MAKDYGKQAILQNIKLVVRPDGVFGYEEQSVSEALDKYAEIYHLEKTLETYWQTRTCYITSNGKRHRLNSPYSRLKNIMIVRIKYRWLLCKYWARHKFKSIREWLNL